MKRIPAQLGEDTVYYVSWWNEENEAAELISTNKQQAEHDLDAKLQEHDEVWLFSRTLIGKFNKGK